MQHWFYAALRMSCFGIETIKAEHSYNLHICFISVFDWSLEFNGFHPISNKTIYKYKGHQYSSNKKTYGAIRECRKTYTLFTFSISI